MRWMLIFVVFSVNGILSAQHWAPAMQGLYSTQDEGRPMGMSINFKEGLMGKDWIYGQFLDNDSLVRYAAYRQAGKWVSLPIHGASGSVAYDIGMFGDTLYVVGNFGNLFKDEDSTSLSNTSIIKYYDDSLWVAPLHILSAYDMAVRGDTVLFWTWLYGDGNDTIFQQVMSPDKGKSWRYPYDIVHPTDTVPDFGSVAKLGIAPNGDIITVNHDRGGSGRPFYGLVRWDGTKWHHYGGIIGGGYIKVLDFEFFRGELYMGGTFGKYNTWNGDTMSAFPQNPGNSVARWDGQQWHELAGGILEGGVKEMFVHDDVLYCLTFAGNPDYHLFGDAKIPYLAGWDGSQWCGTPINYPVGLSPINVGFVNDTLFGVFFKKDTINGNPISYLNYFDGDYVNGPNAICSTPGLGEEEIAAIDFKLFPNPARQEVHISSAEEAIRYLKLYDMAGRCVLEEKFSEGTIEISLDISVLVPGIYVLEVNGSVQRKLVKE